MLARTITTATMTCRQIAQLIPVAVLLALSHSAEVSAQINTSNCSTSDARKITSAWSLITGDIRTNPDIRTNFVDCILSAQLVDTKSCEVQNNRSAIFLPIIETDYDWNFECANLPADGSSSTLADAFVKIEGASMRIDVDFLAASHTTVLELAAVMGHELMHNRGFDHGDFRDTLYPLSVPEQVAACIRGSLFGGTSNPPPYADYWDRKHCCQEARHSFTDSRGTYRATQVCTSGLASVCYDMWEDAASGELIQNGGGFADGFMCMDGSV